MREKAVWDNIIILVGSEEFECEVATIAVEDKIALLITFKPRGLAG